LASAEHPNATTVRRLAAMVYDLFLIVAMWMLTTTAIVANVADDAAITYRLAFQGVLLLELFLFYGYFWTMKGQTLGMQVWKLRTETTSGEILNWRQAGGRFLVGCLTPFFGFVWMLVDRDRLTLYDRFSNSRVVYTGDKPFAKEQPQNKDGEQQEEPQSQTNKGKRKRKKKA
jgi:uncharacterized RDD family membrane protein YckC